MSKYQDRSAVQREELAAARRLGEEVPKCAHYFRYEDDCDLFRSHQCGESELGRAWKALWGARPQEGAK